MATKSKRKNKSLRKQNKKHEEERRNQIFKETLKNNKKKTDDIVKNIKKIEKRNCSADDFRMVFNNDLLIKILEDKNNGEKHSNLFISLCRKKCEKILRDDSYLNKIKNLYALKKHFIRSLDTWERNSYNLEKQFSSIVRHLFCKYDVPLFMDKAWDCNLNLKINYSLTKKDSSISLPKEIRWFIDIGNGKNFRKCEDLPIDFTKKMAHHFLEAPSNYSIENAIRWAEIKSKGGNDRLVETINATFLGRSFNNNEFWSTVIDFLIKNPMIDPATVGPILDYINNQKFTRRAEFINGVRTIIDPVNPGFTMKGRNANTIIQETELWHEALNNQKKTKNTEWTGFLINDYKITEGSKNNKKTYEIVQIFKYKELAKEGSELNHCVLSYASSCSSNKCAIFSLRISKLEGIMERLVTIEVLKDGRIVQVRGKYNRLPNNKEKMIIEKWAIKENLKPFFN